MPKPTSLEEYLPWYKDTLGIDLTEGSIQNRYLSNVLLIKQTLEGSAFFAGLSSKLTEWDTEYVKEHQSSLFMNEINLEVLQKPYQSVINKSFRVNVLWNSNFPKPPKKGWLTPENWYLHLNDLVRLTLNCKFMDGPAFLTSRLLDYAKQHSLTANSYTHQKDSGYYAFHVYGKIPVDLLDANWNKTNTVCEFELQLTTQLQEIMRGLLHTYYEQTRIQPIAKDRSNREDWKWDHQSLLFKSSFLGHTLHLLEGVIVELRDATTTSTTYE